MPAISYVYDGEGRRVLKTIGSATIEYVYDGTGELVAEYGNASSVSGPLYNTADWLGSTRMVSNAAGAPVEFRDYAPFGEEIGPGVGARPASAVSQLYVAPAYPSVTPDVNKVNFTGKERDAETGLDYFGARYMSSAQGRFTSPDPKMFPHDITDPQSWNKYGYTRNNPLRYIDPDGEDWIESIRATVQRYVDALFSHVSSPEALSSPPSGPPSGYGLDNHAAADGATVEFGKGLQVLADAYTAADPTGITSVANSALQKDPTGVVLASIGVLIPGGGRGGGIALSEAKQLVGGWSSGTFEKIGASIAYHFEKRGEEVGAKDVWQYLRKAEGFAKNLKGAEKKALEDGATRHTKNGKYVILDENKKILSYGTAQ